MNPREQAQAQSAVERTLAEQIRERSSGILAIVDGKVRRLFCLQLGRLVHAVSNLIEEQFEAFLLQEGYLSVADRERWQQEGASEGAKLSEWVQEQGVFTESEVDAAIGAHATRLLLVALESRSSEATFQEGTPNLAGKAVVDLALQNILVESLKEHPKSAQEIRGRLGNASMHPVRVIRLEQEIETLSGAHPIVGEIWERCDGDLTALQVAGAISSGQEPALRALYGLQLIGAVEMISGKARSARRVEDVPVTRNELMMRLEKAIDANHYGVLEVNAQADEDEVRSSYYLLARRYHPDRFRSGELKDLLPRIEAYFSQVTEAYNMLADPELRKDYDQELLSADKKVEDDPEHDKSKLARQNYVAAKSLIQRKQFRQAIKFLENAIGLEENVPEYHVAFGSVIALNPVRREEAEEHLRHGLELDPTVLDGHTALADLLVKRDKPTNAIQVLNEGLKWFPDHPELKSRLKELGVDDSRGRGLFRR